MTEQIKQIAARLRGLRESLGLSVKEFASQCKLDETRYSLFEKGEDDIPISVLHNIAVHTNMELTTLLSGDDPHVSAYAVTRKGQGIKMERRAAYSYQSLGSSFQHRHAEPFVVTVEPKDEKEKLTFSTHPGQEFNLVTKGTLKLYIGHKEIILNEGDSIYFDPQSPHAMQAMNNKSCEFLAIIIA